MTPSLDSILRADFLSFALKAWAQLNGGAADLPDDKYLALMADELAAFAAGDTKRLVLNLPPRHFKTFFGSICLPAWILGHQPSARILLLSYSEELAEQNAVAVRKILMSKWFGRLFRTRLEIRRSNFLAVTAGGSLRSLSIDGGVTGFGADFIVIDDPVQIKHAEHPHWLERINTLFDSQIASRLDNPKKGGIAIIAHRLSEADLTGHVMKEGGWRRLALPLRAHRKKNYELRDGTVWHRRKGELLRPKAFSRQELARIEHMPNYQALYQQRPGGDMNLRIRPEHIGRFTDAPHRPTTVLSIDAAQKGGATHSFSVVQAWASVGEKFLLLDQWRDRTSFANFLAEVRRFIRIFRPSVVLIEDAARGPMLAEALRPCEGMLVKLVTPVQSKVDRFRRHRSFVRQGRIQIPAGAVWGRTFSQEITLFPDFETDDQVDALSQFLDYARNNPWPPARRPMAVVALGQPGQISGCSQPSMQTTRGLIAVAPRSSFKRRW